MFAGISVGAVNAVALAEILQAGKALAGKDRLAAQVARFLEFLEAYRDAPGTVLRGIIPDAYETNFRQALKPISLPRHFGKERRQREDSINTRTGFIKLLNGILNIRVRVKSVARFTRIVLGWRASLEQPVLWRRWGVRLSLAAHGWWLLVKNVPVLIILAGRLASIAIFGRLARREKGVEAWTLMFPCRSKEIFLAVFESILGGGVLIVLLLLPVVLLGSAGFALWRHPVASACLAFLGLMFWMAEHLDTLPPDKEKARDGGGIFAYVRDRILTYYGIYSDLGDSYALKEALVRLFNPNYYGRFRLDLGIDRALARRPKAANTEEDDVSDDKLSPEAKLLSCYGASEQRPLKIVPLAANVRSGAIEAVSEGASVVDALMGACAVIPFYKAQRITGTTLQPDPWYIDGVNVANDPVTESLAAMRRDPELVEEIAAHYQGVRVYAVPLLPIEAENLPGAIDTYTGLVDVGLRALQLQKFQDALLAKRLVKAYSEALPKNHAMFRAKQPDGQEMTFFQTDLVNITPALPLNLNGRIPLAESACQRRQLMEEAVAEGCRAFLERLLSPDERDPEDATKKSPLHEIAREIPDNERVIVDDETFIPCRLLFIRKDGTPRSPQGPQGLPGRAEGPEDGPGTPEVCRRCTVAPGAGVPRLARHLRLPRDVAPASPPRNTKPERSGPAVAFVFSGGVFRGVFQVGFANAVSEVNLVPDVIAGASVGTMMGALIGRVLEPAKLEDRRYQVQRLAATFLGVDQFVMTDRFADFVRRFSIRAAGANFSMRDADRVFRRYDVDGPQRFGPRLRRVVAGFEKLFHVSPFALRDLVQTARLRNYAILWNQFQRRVQEWFEHYGVGLELLGPEPLQTLIDGILFDDDADKREQAGFGKSGKGSRTYQLIGTTTNLTHGCLEILGMKDSPAHLVQGLLASSAFPAVFRPRWSWEVFARPASPAQFCDGGVMDNLPLDSVVEYLADRRDMEGPLFPRRPEVPHLILAASLEPEPEDWSDLSHVVMEERCASWMELRRRASELAYNGKIDKFASAQDHIRDIIETRRGEVNPNDADLPLNLEVVVVKPKWLCSTFAFHSMLGFRRRNQAESIAHGCKSTFERLASLFHPLPLSPPLKETPQAFAAREDAARLRREWAARPENLEKKIDFEQLKGAGERRELDATQQANGVCWYRMKISNDEPLCPFAATVARKRASNPELPNDAAARTTFENELDAIYQACGRQETHLRR